MSYDLYFYHEKIEKSQKKGISGFITGLLQPGKVIDSERNIIDFLSSFGNFSGPEYCKDGFDAGYLNEKTGTCVSFSLHRDAIPGVETGHRYPGYEYTGLTAVMKYNRPHYWMLEVAPIIEALCKKFNFLVYNPQESEDLVSCTSESLILTYNKANALVAKHNKPRPNLPHQVYGILESIPWMARGTSYRFWQYMMQHDMISSWLTEHNPRYRAPEIMVLNHTSDNSLHQVMELTDDAGYLIPSFCDAFLVNPHSSRPWLIRRETISEHLGDMLSLVSVMDKKYLTLSTMDTKKIIACIQEIPREDLTSFVRCDPGMWIDVD